MSLENVFRSKKKSLLKPTCYALLFAACLGIVSELGNSYSQYDPVDEPQLRAVGYIKSVNPRVDHDDAVEIVKVAIKWSGEYGIDPATIISIIAKESGFDKHAISQSAALGLMQVLPKWHIDKIKAAKTEVGSPELFDIDANIYIGTRIYYDCRKKTKSLEKALVCYNGGGDPNYAKSVMNIRKQVKELI